MVSKQLNGLALADFSQGNATVFHIVHQAFAIQFLYHGSHRRRSQFEVLCQCDGANLTLVVGQLVNGLEVVFLVAGELIIHDQSVNRESVAITVLH